MRDCRISKLNSGLEIGCRGFVPLNQIVHMWAYESLDERTQRRAELNADEDWKAYVEKIRPLLVTMENKLLIPAPFSPIK